MRIWDVATWRQVQCLSAHALTVTQMGFSRRRGGERLLTVSRDRTWSLWRREEDNRKSVYNARLREDFFSGIRF